MQRGKTSFRRVWGAGAQKNQRLKASQEEMGMAYIFFHLLYGYMTLCLRVCLVIAAHIYKHTGLGHLK